MEEWYWKGFQTNRIGKCQLRTVMASGGILWTQQRALGFHKSTGTSWSTENIDFQEGGRCITLRSQLLSYNKTFLL
jgi:hypothetical protein